MKRLFLILVTLNIMNPVYSFTPDSTMPVELTYFNASQDSNIIRLNWGTATETNNFGYDIERAAYDKQFDAIGFVLGNGNSFSPKYYSFNDTTILQNGVYYYRLKQIDTDGAIEYSDTITVNVNFITAVSNESPLSEFVLYQNYPNPFNPATNIAFELPEDGYVNLTLFDVNGREVKKLLSENKNSGHHNTYLQMQNLPSGFYFYKLSVSIHGKIKYSVSKSLLLLK